MILIRAADCQFRPWQNGGGETREMVVAPANAGFDDCLWRISLATIVASGPFSRFVRIDRTLITLDGGALALTINDEPISVQHFTPVRFAGEAHVRATIEGSPAIVLNVMTRRGAAAADVRRLDGHPHQEASGPNYLVATGPCAIAGMAMTCGDLIVDTKPSTQIEHSGPAPISICMCRLDQ